LCAVSVNLPQNATDRKKREREDGFRDNTIVSSRVLNTKKMTDDDCVAIFPPALERTESMNITSSSFKTYSSMTFE
jgi:hypothetical protein